MADAPDVPRPSQLWKQLPPEKKAHAAEAFWKDEHASAEQAEAVALIAQRIKFRPKSVVTLPREKKARYVASLPAVSELLAARLLVVYHLEQQRPMMGAFLDALGIKHQDGLIEEDDVAAPGDDKLRAAAAAIAERFPAEDVALYLSTLQWQDPETWGGLADAPQSRPPAEE
jgi:hypothetical protein